MSTNPKDLVGEKKAPLHLVPGPALLRMARVMELGAKKYGPYNWRQHPVRLTIYLAAAQRHILADLDGETIDPESGQPHRAHAMACMAILLDAEATGNLIDDRPTPGVTADMIRREEEQRIANESVHDLTIDDVQAASDAIFDDTPFEQADGGEEVTVGIGPRKPWERPLP